MAQDWDGWLDSGDTGLILAQQPGRANMPGLSPSPVPQDGIRGMGQQRQRPQPVQRAPQPQIEPQSAPVEAQPAPANESQDWAGVMSKHGIRPEEWPKFADVAIAAHNGVRPNTGNPALDADIAGFMARNPLRPRQAAAPAQTPSPAPQSQPAPQAMPQQQGPRDWDSELDNRPTVGMPQAQQPAAQQLPNPNAEPDEPTWFRRRMQDIRGKQDPRYQGLPNIASVIQQRGQTWGDLGGEVTSWMLGANDKDMSRTYQSMLGRDFVRTEQDANGYPVIVYNDGGQEKRAYVNNPGMDMQDVAREAYGAVPFAKGAQVVGRAVKAAPGLVRGLAQGGAAAATSLARDAFGWATGATDRSLEDVGKGAGFAAVGGAGGEAVGTALGALMRRIRTEPKLYNATTGTLTPEGEAAARAAGVDPMDLSQQVARDFAKTFSKTGDPEAAFKQAASNEFGIRRTTGELTQNRNQLLREQQMRGGTYGDQAREMVENFDKLQRSDIQRATQGISPPGSQNPTIPSQLAPSRNYQLASGVDKARMGENIRSNTQDVYNIAKTKERMAWEEVPRLKATPEALAEIDGHIAKTFEARGGVLVDDSITPMAAKMAKELETFKAGQAPSKVSSILPDSPAGDIQTMRKRLLKIRNSADTVEDKRAAKAMYDSFLDWEVTAAEKAGDITAAAKARTARDATRNLHEIFDGERGTPGARILADVLKKADSPEAVVNALFTGPTSEIKGGTRSALQNLKRAYETYYEGNPQLAKEAWDDIRLAYWLKMTTDRGGEAKNPAALSSAIKNMMSTQGSVASDLFSPAEKASMRRLAVALDDVKRKNPNTSWSAVGVGALMRDGFNAVLNQIGWNSTLGRTLAGPAVKPFQNAWGRTQAARATGGLQGSSVPAIAPPTLGGLGGALGAQSQQ